MTTTTREEWLTAAVSALTPLFTEVGRDLPAVRVSVGWPGGRGKKNAVIGQCWPTGLAADGVAQLFISPVLDEPVKVLATLTHELVHAVDNCENGHKAAFGRIARALGLEGKLTATTAGADLTEKLTAVAATLGDYPHAALSTLALAQKKQSTRMLKVECAHGSGYIVRMTRKWLDEVGAPSCPCHSEEMVEAS